MNAMKKRFFCFLLVVVSMHAICVSAAAAEATEAQLYYVTDAAGLLSENEDMQLEKMAEMVSQKYGVGVYIVTVDDYQDISTDSVYTATYTVYHEYTMGEGADRNGIMLLLSMEGRDWAMFCYGEQCEYAFNEYGQEMLEEVFLDDFKEDDWYGGFADYIKECSAYLQKAADGKPVRESPVFAIVIVTGMSLFVALLVLGFLWGSMKSVAEKSTANAYIAGNLLLTEKTDKFIHRTETRRRIQTSSSGRSSRSESGGGGSGRSGKF